MAVDAFEFAPFDPTAAAPFAAPAAVRAAAVQPAVDVERIRAEAHAEGYSQGVADGHAVVAPAVAALHAAAGELAALREALAERTEHAAVDLGLRIAQQALQGALAVEPERVVDVVRGALRRLSERERVTVLVAPDDLEAVREHAPALVAELGGIEHCEVQADRRVGRGGALVRTGEAEVDATLDTKLARAREVIEEELGAARDGSRDGSPA
jgi:flagellar assembly protein FliH